MKVIKKITAIMLSIMMVLGMCSVVGAAEAGKGETGSITIKKAIDGQEYKIYKMLELDSFDKDLYSYKPVAEWEEFFKKGAGKDYVDINENGYVTWKAEDGEDDAKKAARAAELSQKALAYVKEKSIVETKKVTATATGEERTTTINFNDLGLGYYLIDSTAGTLCGLTTTNRNVEIQEKNVEPTVEKKVSSEKDGTYNQSNFANIGDKVYFKTVITAQAGAQKYVLHDTMSEGLTFNNDIEIRLNDESGTPIGADNYTIKLNPSVTNATTNLTTDKCTFEIEFTDTFCNNLNTNNKIYVTYSATLNGNAIIGTSTEANNNNTTKITYGEESKESKESTTVTYTLQIPVFKYTGDEKKPLAGAKFALYESATGGEAVKLVQKENTQDYRRALKTESGITEVETTSTGEFNIQGLKLGTYWLEETAAPKGYNKLAKRIEVKIVEHGTLVIDGKTTENNSPINKVNVENKSGSLLPSTGGMGTTIFYIAGAFLVLISGVVLIAKKRTDSK